MLCCVWFAVEEVNTVQSARVLQTKGYVTLGAVFEKDVVVIL